MTHNNSFSLISRGSSRRPIILGLAALISGLAMATTAIAEEACDPTCGAGFVCVTGEIDCDSSDGSGENPSTGEAGAASGGATTRGETEKICEPSSYAYCEPAPCDADADCKSEDMVCAKYTWESCTGGVSVDPCPPDAEDCEIIETPIESTCVEETVKQCEYKWSQPCKAAADCGEGFTCEEQESCSCSSSGSGGAAGVGTSTGEGAATSTEPATRGGASSGGASGSDGSEDDPIEIDVTPPDCSCEPSGVFACRLIEVECSTADDCPAGWMCEPTSYSSTCSVSEDGTEDCVATEAEKICQPANYYGGRGDSVGLDGGANEGGGESTTSGDDKGDEAQPGSAGAGNADEEDDADKDDADSDKDDADEDDDADSAKDPAKSSGGCSVAAPVTDRGALSLVMLGFAAVLGLGRRRSSR